MVGIERYHSIFLSSLQKEGEDNGWIDFLFKTFKATRRSLIVQYCVCKNKNNVIIYIQQTAELSNFLFDAKKLTHELFEWSNWKTKVYLSCRGCDGKKKGNYMCHSEARGHVEMFSFLWNTRKTSEDKSYNFFPHCRRWSLTNNSAARD